METAQPLVIINTQLVPPGGWRYVQIESGAGFADIVLDNLKKKIRTHREANGYDLEDGWWEQVQMEMCLDLGIFESHCGFKVEDPTAADPLRIKVIDLLGFFKTMKAWVLEHGFTQVPQAEAERRSAICLDCPMNRKVKGCLACQGVARWLGDLLNNNPNKELEKTDSDKDLENCAVCKCVLTFKVRAPMDALLSATPDTSIYPTHCWMRNDP